MSSLSARIPIIDVGTPATPPGSNYDAWELINVRFHGFEDLPADIDESVDSPEFTFFGHQWRLRLCPGGERGAVDGRISLRLCHKSNEHIKIDFGFRVKSNGRGFGDFCYGNGGVKFGNPPARGTPRSFPSTWGKSNFIKRSDIIDHLLVDGALIIEVRIKHIPAVDDQMKPFVGKNPIFNAILAQFMDESSSDVLFEVSKESASSTNASSQNSKRAKTSTVFHAHRFVLMAVGSTLGELCRSKEGMAPIPINDVTPEIFRHILYYSYGGKVPVADMNANSKEIIDAADRYGVVGLKLEAEAALVSSIDITIDNVMDNLLYADSMNCALLKETAVDFLVKNGEEAYERLSFDDVPGSVMKDFLAATNRMGLGSASDATTSLGTRRVNSLRKMLHERGLDIDGSREAMIARLGEN